jgi:DNA-binding NarL/FixJ family response regulator
MESSFINSNPLNVLLIGNNPMEMGTVLDKLNQVRSQKITTEIAFDLRSILQRLIRFKPNFIFIDDNIGRVELREAVKELANHGKTKHIPITVLKSSNYHEALGASSILDYLLKENLSADALYNTVRNSLKFRKTQLYLNKVYQKRKTQLAKTIH